MCLALCLYVFLPLSPGIESFYALSPQELLHGHCHALRGLSTGAVCWLCYRCPATSPQESGKKCMCVWGNQNQPSLAFFVPFYKALVTFAKKLFVHEHVPFFSVMHKHLFLKQQVSVLVQGLPNNICRNNPSLLHVSNYKTGEYENCTRNSDFDVKNFTFQLHIQLLQD